MRHWSDAGVFLAVARAGSTLAAARALGMSQNTVARRIDELEAGLGLVLFERDTRGFRLTAEGKALVGPAEGIERAAHAFLGAADAARPDAGRPIRLSATEASFTPYFSDKLRAFLDENPGVRIDLVSSDRVLDLCAGEADVALRNGRIEDERLICQRTGEHPFTFYASEAYVARHGRPGSLAEVGNHPLVLFRAKLLQELFPDIGAQGRVVSEGDTVRAAVTAIHSGLGVGPLPLYVGNNEPGLVQCFAPPQGAVVPSWVVASPAAHRRPEVRRLTAFLARELRAFFRERDQTPTSGPLQ